jgi:uncharacterized membrane protein YccC
VIAPNRSEILYSFKCFGAAMLALYLAFRIGLPRPFWAMLTAYVVANPLSGLVRSKALYRFAGTLLGSSVTVLLVPQLGNSPELLSLALAGWVGACLYLSLLDRTPRSYVFMLAGYTAGLIAFPVVADPSTVFEVALARVEEITLGIACATLVHSLVFPQSVGLVLLGRVDHAINDARQWIREALTAAPEKPGKQARWSLAGDITELRVMSTHLPFDTSHLRWMSGSMQALHDQLALMVPLLSAIEDRLDTLRRHDPASLNIDWQALLADIAQWCETQSPSPDHPVRLCAAINRITPAIGSATNWSTLLQVNLAIRLQALVAATETCMVLRRQIDAVLEGRGPIPSLRQNSRAAGALHLDHGLALRSAFAAFIAIMVCCAFWIVTGWPAGAGAPTMAAVFCCFFATQDDPVPGIRTFLNFTLLSIPISAFYLLVVIPSVHDFALLMLVSAPIFLLLGVFAGRPATALQAIAVLFGVAGMLSLQDTGSANMLSFTNGMLAQLTGLAAAVFFTRLLRSVSTRWVAHRLLRTGRNELVSMSTARRAPALTDVSARMLDRIALLTLRLATAGPEHDTSGNDALIDLRIGLGIAQLRALQAGLEQAGLPLQPLLQQLAQYYRQPAGTPASGLLDAVDTLIRALCAARLTDASAALTGIRRNLFPAAPPYFAPGTATEHSR